jgi:hypothetical protein
MKVYCICWHPDNPGRDFGGVDWYIYGHDRDTALSQSGWSGTPFNLEVDAGLSAAQITPLSQAAARYHEYTPIEHHVIVWETVDGGRAPYLTYEYSLGEGVVMEFHTLAEVGEPWRANARAAADELAATEGKVVATINIDYAPWVVDALTEF